MAAGKQESLQDYFLMAKEIAKEEKNLGIEHWDGISIQRDGDKAGEYVRLYHYDLPRQLAEKYDWVIRWRAAKLQCQYPRYCVRVYHSPYKKVMGVNIGMQKDIDTFVAAKAQYTKQSRTLDDYISKQKASNMFFNEDTDQEVVRFKAKLERKKENIEQAEARLIEKVKQYKIQQNNQSV